MRMFFLHARALRYTHNQFFSALATARQRIVSASRQPLVMNGYTDGTEMYPNVEQGIPSLGETHNSTVDLAVRAVYHCCWFFVSIPERLFGTVDTIFSDRSH